MSLRALSLTVLLVLGLPGNALAGKASFGFAVELDTSGFMLNPTIEAASIARIAEGSPAQKAGLRVGDLLLSANGTPVAGAKAKKLSALMDSLGPGDLLRLKVRRLDGTESLVEVVAGTR